MDASILFTHIKSCPIGDGQLLTLRGLGGFI